MKNFEKKRFPIYWILTAILLLACFATLVSHIKVWCNDDTYIYFNYARNLVAGHGFAYDCREIPSEGFTSLLYLLLLVPFEALGTNLMFVSILLNLLAVIVIVIVAAALVRTDGLLEREYVGLFTLVLLGLIGLDTNVRYVIGWALETMLGPAAVLLAVYCAVQACNRTQGDSIRARLWSRGFLIASFLAYLIRPENLVSLGLCGILFLYWYPNRKQLLLDTTFLVVAILALIIWKWWVFGDVFSTGYYRKMHASIPWPGKNYVLGAIKFYQRILIVVCAGFFTIAIGRHFFTRRNPVSLSRSLPFLIIVAGTSLIIVLKIKPLNGHGFRYLVNAYISLHISLALLIVLLIQMVLTFWVPVKVRQIVLTVSTVVVAVILVGLRILQMDGTMLSLNLYRRAEQAVARHHYLRLGKYMKENLADHEHVTLVFGDAGCIPYASECTFVDSNGLTEPYIARLFKETDGAKKAKLFINYVMQWDPDIIVLAAGRTRKGFKLIRGNLHSPFLNKPRLEVYAGYRKHGVMYFCSLPAYYDLHFGLRPSSPHFNTVAPVLLEYCKQNGGYVLKDGLTVFQGGRSVKFPGIIVSP